MGNHPLHLIRRRLKVIKGKVRSVVTRIKTNLNITKLVLIIVI
jgi:hypothetical protein